MSDINNEKKKVVSLRKQPKDCIIQILEKLKDDVEIEDIVILCSRKDDSKISINSFMTNERFLWILETEKIDFLSEYRND